MRLTVVLLFFLLLLNSDSQNTQTGTSFNLNKHKLLPLSLHYPILRQDYVAVFIWECSRKYLYSNK